MGTEVARDLGANCACWPPRASAQRWGRFPCISLPIFISEGGKEETQNRGSWRKRMGIEPTPLADTGAGLRF